MTVISVFSASIFKYNKNLRGIKHKKSCSPVLVFLVHNSFRTAPYTVCTTAFKMGVKVNQFLYKTFSITTEHHTMKKDILLYS